MPARKKAKSKPMKTAQKTSSPKKKELGFVVVSNNGYGKALKGIKIYYEGKKPKGLNKDGSITFGKHSLEALKRKFKDEKFRLILTEKDDGIKLERGIYRVRVSAATFKSMGDSLRERTRDIKNDIVAKSFSLNYPDYFTHDDRVVYVAGTLSHMLSTDILQRLSTEDRTAMNAFLPGYISSESLNAVNLLKATAQIKTLKELAADLEIALENSYAESWWQSYIKKNILIIQQGYIAALDKMNIAVGTTKFPDFALITHDNYLDILEIKKPNTPLLKKDDGRGNYYWDPEIAKAVIQVENYIESVVKHADTVRTHIDDNHGLKMKAIRPRGIILAGDTRKFTTQKERDDFRLLSLSTKNVTFVTYDELLSRLRNYIKVLEDHSK